MRPKDAEGMVNSVDPNQEQSDLGLHCLPRPVCLKTKDHLVLFRFCFFLPKRQPFSFYALCLF